MAGVMGGGVSGLEQQHMTLYRNRIVKSAPHPNVSADGAPYRTAMLVATATIEKPWPKARVREIKGMLHVSE